jgi:hypothetical protein
MENGVAILWKNYLQLSVKNSCKKQPRNASSTEETDCATFSPKY